MRDQRRQLKTTRYLWLLVPYVVLAVCAGFLHTCGERSHGVALTDHARTCAACAWTRTQAAETIAQPSVAQAEAIDDVAPAVISGYHHELHIYLGPRAPPVV